MTMKARAAVLTEQPGKWHIEEVDLDPPKDFEVLVEFAATGLCHSDDHMAKGDIPCSHLPYNGGHEGAGVVLDVGPGVRLVKPGDHIVTSFIPSCGRCRWCASGMQNLCDLGGVMGMGALLDGTYRKHLNGVDIAQSAFAGTFSSHTVMPEWGCIKIPEHIPLQAAALLGCGVPTGWGSAVYAAETKPGDVIIVVGVGGIGMSAVQGAAHAGATRVIAVDPVAFKRDMSTLFGATDAFATMEEATDLARSLTNGQGADATILAVGVLTSADVATAVDSIRKGGTVVMTAVARADAMGIPVNLVQFAMFQKRIQGVLFGMMSPAKDVPRLLSMYERGQLKLDEMVTRTYTLDEINQGYDDLHAGTNLRGVVLF